MNVDPQWAGGRPRLISPEDEAFIVATATTRPEKPFTRWVCANSPPTSPRTLPGVVRVGRERLRRPLTIRPHLGAGWARKGHPERLPANYHNTLGVRQFHGCYSVGDGTLRGVVRRKKSAANTLTALKSIRAVRPGGWSSQPITQAA
jgi:hypothetical protein